MTAATPPTVQQVRAAHRRRRVRWAAATLVALLIGIVFGVSTAHATANLGPHEAEYSMAWSDKVVVDLGPLGTLRIPSPLPLGLGARVTVKEIPENLDLITEADSLSELGQDLNSYVQFFTSPSTTLTMVTHRLVVDATQRALLLAATIVGAAVGVRALLGGVRRRELLLVIRQQRRRLTVGTATAVAVTLLVTSAAPAGRRTEPPASPVFAGTVLAGTQVTGRLGALLDSYGSDLLDQYRDVQDEYDRIEAATRAAWQKRAEQIAASTSSGEDDDGDDDRKGEDEHTIVTMVMTSDLHCNVGMARVIGAVAELSGASIVIDGGDITISGTAVEDYCVKAFASAVPDGAKWVTVTGNHDSPETAVQEEASGAVVLRGDTAKVEGVRFLGDDDSYRTVFGTPTVTNGIDPDEQALALAEKSCDADVDILLLHRPSVAHDAVAAGCIPVALSGHLHVRIGPLVDGNSVTYVNSTSGGAAEGKATIGKLGTTAEITVFRFDTTDHVMLDSQLVTVTPSGKATVGPRRLWPVP